MDLFADDRPTVADRLTADIYDHKGWFGLGNETRHKFSADITGMELLVNKSYADSD